MKKLMILLLLIVQVFGGRKYPGVIRHRFYDILSVPISHTGGTTFLQPDDDRLVKLVNYIINHINSYVKPEGDKLNLNKTGKVELKVINNDQRHSITNVFTFNKLMCISRDGLTEVSVYGPVSIIYDTKEFSVKPHLFVNIVISNHPIPYKESVRRKSLPGDINDKEKNKNVQRRPSFKL